VHHVGGQEAETGAVKARPELAAALRMAAAMLQAPQLLDAVVELVVADCVERQAHPIHGFHGGLVLEQRRHERAGVDQVSCGYEHVMADPCAQPLQVRSQKCGAPRRPSIDQGRWPRRRLEVAVEVVDRQDAHRHGIARLRLAPHSGRQGEEQKKAEYARQVDHLMRRQC
jgi:hypothetical protein